MNWFLFREGITILGILIFYTLPIGVPIYLYTPEYLPVLIGICLGAVFISILYSVARGILHRYRQDYLQSPELQQTLEDFVTPLSRQLSVPTPSVRVITKPSVNARAGGLSYKTGHIELTEGLVNYLPPESLQVVVSHELSHIKSRDSPLIHLLQGPYSIIVSLMIVINYFQAKTNSMIISIPLLVIQISVKLYATGLLLGIRSIMRGREHLADSDAVRATSKEAVIETLEQLRALSDDSTDSTSLFSEYTDSLFSTHPSLQDRIEYIEKKDFSSES